ncbi:uncharacterized protein LOC127842701 [Dreissena polymorpha]|uniref:Ig-like domain-containing protein n=1 Tax=Dreissena polymorpha TaxID=45954 RepID=A0A9D4EQ48_DREPO|nr:uncharacterized protein LOC127842701 [Dreissena polymorpha]KAH3783713.1 hypothetical protein DPMN_161656 [Dreissena polymorpha]
MYMCCLVQGFWSRPPMTLKLWKHQVEVSARSLRVKVGSEFSVTCDGSAVGSNVDPHLRWYGTNKWWIANKGRHERVHIDHSLSRRFLKLNIRHVITIDAGVYTCRGWMGQGHGWDHARITLVVDDTEAGNPKPNIRPSRPTTQQATAHSNAVYRKLTTYLPPIRTYSNITTKSEMMLNVTNARVSDTGCRSPNHPCGSGECIDTRSVCDGNPDCPDGSDESNCSSIVCTEGTTACPQGKGCLLSEHICDGRPHCPDGWDESAIFCGK